MASGAIDEAELSGKRDDKVIMSGKITDKLRLSGKKQSELPITDAFVAKITDIYIFISSHPHSSSEDIASFMGKSKESAKKYLRALVAIGMLSPEGGNKNRTYSIKD